VHPAGLNVGDCFAYAEAKYLKCPLLFVGNDFSKNASSLFGVG
jgi:ribonuclease VapC